MIKPRAVGLMSLLLLCGAVTGTPAGRAALAVEVTTATEWIGPEIAARAALADELRPLQHLLRTEYPDAFGGLWIDESGRPHVALVGLPQKVIEIVQDSDLSAEAILENAQVSEVDLNGLMNEIRKAYEDRADGSRFVDGIEIAQVALDLRRNAVVIDVLSGKTADADVLRNLFGQSVLAQLSTSKPTPVACTSRSNCGAPMKAGLKLFYVNDEPACTTAFQVVTGTANYILTAGHCHHPSRNTRYHPMDFKIGAQDAYSVSGRADAMRIFLSSSSSVSNKLFQSTTSILAITSAEQISGPNAEVEGEAVCASKPSGNRCGNLVHAHIDIPGLIDQREASNMWACGGDSGAPVYLGGKAIGVIVQSSISGSCGQQGSDSFYSHIYWVQDILNVALRIS